MLHHRIFLYTCVVTYVLLVSIFPILLLSLYYFIFYYYKCNKCNTISITPLFIGFSGVTFVLRLVLLNRGKRQSVTLLPFAGVGLCCSPCGVGSAIIGCYTIPGYWKTAKCNPKCNAICNALGMSKCRFHRLQYWAYCLCPIQGVCSIVITCFSRCLSYTLLCASPC